MPMDFLVKVRDASLPLQVTDATQINCLALLAAAKLVVADVPEPILQPGKAPAHPAATLHSITRLGRIALEELDKEQRRKPKAAARALRKRQGEAGG